MRFASCTGRICPQVPESRESLYRQARDYDVQDHSRAWGGPSGSGILRTVPEDFFVEELLGAEPEDDGPHLLLFVEKRGLNTKEVAERLRAAADLAAEDVGHAGLKDKWAVTRQWFSLDLRGRRPPDLSSVESQELRILKTGCDRTKLRPGDHEGNRFVIRARACTGDPARMESILGAIEREGFPNYFGSQRFGRGNANLKSAAALFQGRRLEPWSRGISLSAARSLLFNTVLDARVRAGSWNRPLEGEVLEIAGTRSWFLDFSRNLPLIVERCGRRELHPTGPLWGGHPRTPPRGEAKDVEIAALAPYRSWITGLEKAGAEMARRSLRAFPRELSWCRDGDDWEIRFVLDSGGFATALLRECLVPGTQQSG